MNASPAATLDKATRYGLIALALVQGYALYFLQLAIEKKVWPATEDAWLVALYSCVIGLPAFLYLGMARAKDKRNLWAALIVGGLLLWLGHHLGWVLSATGVTSSGAILFGGAYVLSLGVTLFIAALFFRLWSTNGRLAFDYRQLLAGSWQQALTLALLGLFVGVFWMLLWLWAGLFKIIDIRFFMQLFGEAEFVYPVTWLVLGLGLVMIRQRVNLIATLQFMCEALIKALLPLAALIEVLFLAALPMTGVAPILDTGYAALLMMALALVLLFFFNAVLNSDPEARPYPGFLRAFILLAVALLPVTTLLSGWALWLRIEQYGVTFERLWAGLILLLIASFTFSYAWLVIRWRSCCLEAMAQANKWLALLLAMVLVLANSPLADLRAWAAHGQVERLLAGKVAVADFDYDYLRFSLGRPGVEALRDLQQSDFVKQHPDAASRIRLALAQQKRWQQKQKPRPEVAKDIAVLFTVVPAKAHLPPALLQTLAEGFNFCTQATSKCLAYQLSLGADEPGWMLVSDERYADGSIYLKQAGKWLRMGRVDISCDKRDDYKNKVQRLASAALQRLATPALSYTDGKCFYVANPARDYLQQLRPQ